MFIRNAIVLAALVTVVVFPAAAAAQDAAAVLQSVREGIAKEVPTSVRITAAGSGYAAVPAAASRRQFRIESYTQELDLGAASASERLVRLETGDGGKTVSHTDVRAVKADSPWTDQYAVWMSPFGFLAGAAARQASVATETLHGTPYRVLSFGAANGQQVRGYVTEKNVLERTRTIVEDGARGKVQVEAVFFDWRDFNGVKFPSLIIQKENDQVVRILVVEKVEAGVATRPDSGK